MGPVRCFRSMVTKRARRWLARGITAAVIAVVLVLTGATWIYSEVIEEELLHVTPMAPDRDPSEVGVVFDDVKVSGPLGPLPAWYSSGVDDTWVLMVHDHTGTRADTLDVLPIVKRLGFPILMVTYRNDVGAPSSPNEHFGLGQNEWPDLEAAAEYAFEGGAEDLVVVGFGSGAAVASAFVHESDRATRVQGLVFDAPLLDAASVVDRRAEAEDVPGFITGWAKGMATLRFGIDWDKVDQVRRADEFADLGVPILLFHGTADEVIPVGPSDAFAEALPDLVEYERFAGAGHGEVWDADPDRYAGAVETFLNDVALGPTVLRPLDREP